MTTGQQRAEAEGFWDRMDGDGGGRRIAAAFGSSRIAAASESLKRLRPLAVAALRAV